MNSEKCVRNYSAIMLLGLITRKLRTLCSNGSYTISSYVIVDVYLEMLYINGEITGIKLGNGLFISGNIAKMLTTKPKALRRRLSTSMMKKG